VGLDIKGFPGRHIKSGFHVRYLAFKRFGTDLSRVAIHTDPAQLHSHQFPDQGNFYASSQIHSDPGIPVLGAEPLLHQGNCPHPHSIWVLPIQWEPSGNPGMERPLPVTS